MSRRHHEDRGAQLLEFGVYLPFLLLICLLSLEMAAQFIALERIEETARVTAREAAEGNTETAHYMARQHLPPFLEDADVRIGPDGTGVYTEVTVEAPVLFSFDLNYTLQRRVEMPRT